MPVTIGVGRVKHGDTLFQGRKNEGCGLLVIGWSVEFAHCHTAESQCGHLRTLFAKPLFFHDLPFLIQVSGANADSWL
jgi:hypothetical protein